MSVSNPQKTIVPNVIDCEGTATVTIGFDATAEFMLNPADIVLVMDKSSSMNFQRMFHAKTGAKALIDIVAEASGSASEGTIGGESSMGIVCFASTATKLVSLTQNVTQLKSMITSIQPGGETNHTEAFEAAESMLGPKGTKRQVIIMFTDGITTQGGDPLPVTDRLKAAGVEIYCIGLIDNPEYLMSWASEPVSEHVAYTDDYKKLDEIFRNIASEVVLAGTQDVVIREELSPDFKILTVQAPEFGTAKITGQRTLTWNLDHAGLTQDPTTFSLSFEIMHTGIDGGRKEFNQSLIYEDRNGNTLEFPSPVVEVKCTKNPDIYPEPCPVPVEFNVPGCKDAVRVRMNGIELTSLGRIIQLDLTLKGICPGKRVGVSVILTETGPDRTEQNRGVKHFLVPAQKGENCQDITLNCIQFSVPEILDIDGSTGDICNSRTFRARVIANYIDTDYSCCDI